MGGKGMFQKVATRNGNTTRGRREKEKQERKLLRQERKAYRKNFFMKTGKECSKKLQHGTERQREEEGQKKFGDEAEDLQEAPVRVENEIHEKTLREKEKP